MTSVQILAPISDAGSPTSQADILTKKALDFVVLLHRTFDGKRRELLANREKVQKEIDQDLSRLDFISKDKLDISRQAWKGAIPAPGLADRRTEITGPPERKMIVNALNTPVKTYMADFEDSTSPTWQNVLNGQVNLYDAIRQQIDFETPAKAYKVNREGRHVPVLIVRPRGWHMVDKHILVDGEPISGSILDFGLYFFHNAHQLVANGLGPYFYLPKMQHHLEARLWNDIFNVAQDILSIPRGTIRATVLIETLPAAYQMEEIIYELRDHSAGLNCGRWDYIFSTIKTLKNHPQKILPDRNQVTMTVPFMSSYCKRLINVCHRRGVHAMGGMAAQIPIKTDPEANERAMAKVAADKLREVTMHYDGTWVAHPALAPIANDIFNTHMPTPNQMFIIPEQSVQAQDLSNTSIDGGMVTVEGIRQNVYIALCYMESWIRGVGCVPINHLMEDAATAEVSRLMIYSWVKHNVQLGDQSGNVTPELTAKILEEETAKLVANSKEGNKFELAAKYLLPEFRGEQISDFLTTLVYDEIVEVGEPIDLASLRE
ncbi:malate synthase 2 [[Candida] anglica]